MQLKRMAAATLNHLTACSVHWTGWHPAAKRPCRPPPSTKPQLRLIGATTLNEYREHVEKDAAFERRFQQVCGQTVTVS